MPNAKLDALLRAIIACLGRNTIDPKIHWNEEEHAFTIQVDGHDQGRFIGKMGIILWAINTVFWYAGLAQIQHTVKINLLNPLNPKPGIGQMPYRPNPSWNRQIVKAMAEAILGTCFNSDPRMELRDTEQARAAMLIKLEKYLQTPCSSPDIGEAIEKLVYAGGMVDGGSIKTEIRWE